MSLPPETPFEEVRVRLRNCYTNPNIKSSKQVVLKDGPQAFRVATIFEILDPKTGESHHFSLKIDSIDRRKAGWFHKAEKSVTLGGIEPNEIERLYHFLTAFYAGELQDRTGDLHLVSQEEYAKLEALLAELPRIPASDQLALVRTILSQLDGSPSLIGEFTAAFQDGNPEIVRHIGIAARAVEYQTAFDEFVTLIEEPDTAESATQRHLTLHPWIFGSEYSELLDRRKWMRDSSLDFMLRRTVDNFLEIVEIKTPSPRELFRHDSSHDSYYPSAPLSKVIGQVMQYIEEAERHRDSIRSKDEEDPLKIRARIIVGRDGSTGQQIALRNLNAHIHRIEVLTFDQLRRIARRVLSVFVDEPEQEEVGAPDPF